MTKPRGDLQLALGYWIVSHRDQFRKWWVLALLGFISLSLVWSIGFFGYFYSRLPATEEAVLGAATSIQGLQVPASALPIDAKVDSVSFVSRGSGRFDLVAFVQNPNTNWGAQVATGHFSLNGTAMESQNFFLNPNQTQTVLRLNVSNEGGIQNAEFIVDDVTWLRSASAALPSVVFATSNIILSQTNVTFNGQTFLTYNVRGTISNRSVYNLLRVPVPLILRSGNTIVGVEEITLDRWPTLTDKSVNFSWTYPIAQADKVSIEPSVSQFDSSNLYR